MFKLYYSPGSCAMASHITLQEAGADYRAERIDFKANQQNSPEYLAINPKGRVPSLVTDQGILTETPAVLAFIAQSFPNARLAPLDDPWAFAQVQAFNSYLCSTVHVAHAHKARGYRWNPEGNARPRAWYIDVAADLRDPEIAYLQQEIYQGEVNLLVTRIDAHDRFSDRV